MIRSTLLKIINFFLRLFILLYGWVAGQQLVKSPLPAHVRKRLLRRLPPKYQHRAFDNFFLF